MDNNYWKGEPGENGTDGKTAYQYAQEGGFAGTEQEFSKKLAGASDEQIAEAVQAYLTKNPSDATVTTDSITKALGYTPANAETVSALQKEKADQANILWAILQKTAFAEQLTDAELTAFKTAWGIIEATIPATSIRLDKTTLEFTTATTQKITATVEPSDTTDKISWISSNENVAKVANGIVTPIANGSATITATVGSFSANCEVTVNVEDIVTYNITRNLTGCSSSSSVTAINENDAHSETITANNNYTLDGATVSVTMGGSDISDKYTDGVLTIDSVTGDIVINVSAMFVNSEEDSMIIAHYDFTSSSDGVVNSKDVTFDANGLTMTTNAGYVVLPNFGVGVVAEVVFGEFEAPSEPEHHRTIMFNQDENFGAADSGFIYRNTGSWQIYSGSWNGETEYTDATEISNKTVYVWIDETNTVYVRLNDKTITYKGTKEYDASYDHLQLGGQSNGFNGLVVKSVTMYKKGYEGVLV